MDNEALDRMTSALVGASLTDEVQMGLLDTQPVIQILPDANVIKISGQSFIDRGRAAVFPLIEEIVESLPRHKMIIGTGAGTRPDTPIVSGSIWVCRPACSACSASSSAPRTPR